MRRVREVILVCKIPMHLFDFTNNMDLQVSTLYVDRFRRGAVMSPSNRTAQAQTPLQSAPLKTTLNAQ